ncbi:hypothetical protein JNB91_22080 [Rhizobium wenxiniae]|uniref:hypothetical protein n=1 Tax=Rhizobium wenxiniae TaxID=1737357 RepID=UPI001C6E5FDF|nr:hypothetical protein [Rhizobium wenxiniae]MBW9090508.1 hypothetical protein [Rhizobium wenxiniae]
MPDPNQLTVWDIRRSALSQFDDLIIKQNVSHITIGHKHTDGICTHEKSLIFYVRDKQDVAPNETIPKTIEAKAKDDSPIGDILTDVQQAGEAEPFGWRSGHMMRGSDDDIGVCAVSFSVRGQKYLVTNAHVVVDAANGGIGGPPAIFNRTDGKFYQLGAILKATTLTRGAVATSDLAIIEVPQNHVVDSFMILDTQNDIDAIEGIGTFAQSQYWYMVNGVRHHCSMPERIVGTMGIMVDGVLINYSEFWQLKMNPPTSGKGHSGALLCRSQGDEIIACGLVFGGIPQTHVFAFPFNKMWQMIQSAVG